MLTVRYDLLDVSPDDRVLDLGCGAGRHTFEAQKRGAFVVAADLDAAVLKDVKAMASAVSSEAPGAGTGTCSTADALALPFADGSFDRVIASEVLEHIPSDVAAMREIERVLRPGGRLVVTVPRWWPERVCWALSDDYHNTAGGHVRIYRRQELLAKLTTAGFAFERSHHAHAFHAPYWWLKCAVGIDDPEASLPSKYHRFLVWDIETGHRWMRLLERSIDPLLGKSIVLYLRKVGPRAA